MDSCSSYSSPVQSFHSLPEWHSCKVSALWQVQYVVFLLYQHVSMKQHIKGERPGDTKSIERRQSEAGYETLARKEPVSEWQVAWPRGLLMKRVCLPAYWSSHNSWSEACLTGRPGEGGGLMGTWGHTQRGGKHSGQQVCICVCVCAEKGMVVSLFFERVLDEI